MQTGMQTGEHQAVLRLTTLMLRHRFGDDPRSDAVAAKLSTLPDDDRLNCLDAATELDDLAG